MKRLLLSFGMLAGLCVQAAHDPGNIQDQTRHSICMTKDPHADVMWQLQEVTKKGSTHYELVRSAYSGGTWHETTKHTVHVPVASISQAAAVVDGAGSVLLALSSQEAAQGSFVLEVDTKGTTKFTHLDIAGLSVIKSFALNDAVYVAGQTADALHIAAVAKGAVQSVHSVQFSEIFSQVDSAVTDVCSDDQGRLYASVVNSAGELQTAVVSFDTQDHVFSHMVLDASAGQVSKIAVIRASGAQPRFVMVTRDDAHETRLASMDMYGLALQKGDRIQFDVTNLIAGKDGIVVSGTDRFTIVAQKYNAQGTAQESVKLITPGVRSGNHKIASHTGVCVLSDGSIAADVTYHAINDIKRNRSFRNVNDPLIAAAATVVVPGQLDVVLDGDQSLVTITGVNLDDITPADQNGLTSIELLNFSVESEQVAINLNDQALVPVSGTIDITFNDGITSRGYNGVEITGYIVVSVDSHGNAQVSEGLLFGLINNTDYLGQHITITVGDSNVQAPTFEEFTASVGAGAGGVTFTAVYNGVSTFINVTEIVLDNTELAGGWHLGAADEYGNLSATIPVSGAGFILLNTLEAIELTAEADIWLLPPGSTNIEDDGAILVLEDEDTIDDLYFLIDGQGRVTVSPRQLECTDEGVCTLQTRLLQITGVDHDNYNGTQDIAVSFAVYPEIELNLDSDTVAGPVLTDLSLSGAAPATITSAIYDGTVVYVAITAGTPVAVVTGTEGTEYTISSLSFSGHRNGSGAISITSGSATLTVSGFYNEVIDYTGAGGSISVSLSGSVNINVPGTSGVVTITGGSLAFSSEGENDDVSGTLTVSGAGLSIDDQSTQTIYGSLSGTMTYTGLAASLSITDVTFSNLDTGWSFTSGPSMEGTFSSNPFVLDSANDVALININHFVSTGTLTSPAGTTYNVIFDESVDHTAFAIGANGALSISNGALDVREGTIIAGPAQNLTPYPGFTLQASINDVSGITVTDKSSVSATMNPDFTYIYDGVAGIITLNDMDIAIDEYEDQLINNGWSVTGATLRWDNEANLAQIEVGNGIDNATFGLAGEGVGGTGAVVGTITIQDQYSQSTTINVSGTITPQLENQNENYEGQEVVLNITGGSLTQSNLGGYNSDISVSLTLNSDLANTPNTDHTIVQQDISSFTGLSAVYNGVYVIIDASDLGLDLGGITTHGDYNQAWSCAVSNIHLAGVDNNIIYLLAPAEGDDSIQYTIPITFTADFTSTYSGEDGYEYPAFTGLGAIAVANDQTFSGNLTITVANPAGSNDEDDQVDVTIGGSLSINATSKLGVHQDIDVSFYKSAPQVLTVTDTSEALDLRTHLSFDENALTYNGIDVVFNGEAIFNDFDGHEGWTVSADDVTWYTYNGEVFDQITEENPLRVRVDWDGTVIQNVYVDGTLLLTPQAPDGSTQTITPLEISIGQYLGGPVPLKFIVQDDGTVNIASIGEGDEYVYETVMLNIDSYSDLPQHDTGLNQLRITLDTDDVENNPTNYTPDFITTQAHVNVTLGLTELYVNDFDVEDGISVIDNRVLIYFEAFRNATVVLAPSGIDIDTSDFDLDLEDWYTDADVTLDYDEEEEDALVVTFNGSDTQATIHLVLETDRIYRVGETDYQNDIDYIGTWTITINNQGYILDTQGNVLHDGSEHILGLDDLSLSMYASMDANVLYDGVQAILDVSELGFLIEQNLEFEQTYQDFGGISGSHDDQYVFTASDVLNAFEDRDEYVTGDWDIEYGTPYFIAVESEELEVSVDEYDNTILRVEDAGGNFIATIAQDVTFERFGYRTHITTLTAEISGAIGEGFVDIDDFTWTYVDGITPGWSIGSTGDSAQLVEYSATLDNFNEAAAYGVLTDNIIEGDAYISANALLSLFLTEEGVENITEGWEVSDSGDWYFISASAGYLDVEITGEGDSTLRIINYNTDDITITVGIDVVFSKPGYADVEGTISGTFVLHFDEETTAENLELSYSNSSLNPYLSDVTVTNAYATHHADANLIGFDYDQQRVVANISGLNEYDDSIEVTLDVQVRATLLYSVGGGFEDVTIPNVLVTGTITGSVDRFGVVTITGHELTASGIYLDGTTTDEYEDGGTGDVAVRLIINEAEIDNIDDISEVQGTANLSGVAINNGQSMRIMLFDDGIENLGNCCLANGDELVDNIMILQGLTVQVDETVTFANKALDANGAPHLIAYPLPVSGTVGLHYVDTNTPVEAISVSGYVFVNIVQDPSQDADYEDVIVTIASADDIASSLYLDQIDLESDYAGLLGLDEYSASTDYRSALVARVNVSGEPVTENGIFINIGLDVVNEVDEYDNVTAYAIEVTNNFCPVSIFSANTNPAEFMTHDSIDQNQDVTDDAFFNHDFAGSSNNHNQGALIAKSITTLDKLKNYIGLQEIYDLMTAEILDGIEYEADDNIDNNPDYWIGFIEACFDGASNYNGFTAEMYNLSPDHGYEQFIQHEEATVDRHYAFGVSFLMYKLHNGTLYDHANIDTLLNVATHKTEATTRAVIRAVQTILRRLGIIHYLLRTTPYKE